MIRVALDVLGGEAAPNAPIAGAQEAVRAWADEITLLLVGPEEAVVSRLSEFPVGTAQWIPADEAIDLGEPPALAVRRKPGSSIVRGLEAVRDGEADAFVSAGSTGAIVVASVLTLGLLPGIDRPPVGALFPTATGRVLVLDVGADIDVRPAQLHQYAHLGSSYLSDIQRPRVGLLNVGEEADKGGGVSVAAYSLLSADPGIEFVGNVEGNQIIAGACDVVVCGGFVGNVLLKFYGSIRDFVVEVLRKEGFGEVGDLDGVLRVLDGAEYGGAPLFGVDGVSVICHGGSPPRAIKNAIRTAVDAVSSSVVQDMHTRLEALQQHVERQ